MRQPAPRLPALAPSIWASADSKAESVRTAPVPVQAAASATVRVASSPRARRQQTTALRRLRAASVIVIAGRWRFLPSPRVRPRPAQAIPRAPLSNPDSAPRVWRPGRFATWIWTAFPLDMVLAYAGSATSATAMAIWAPAQRPWDERPIRAAASGLTRSVVLRESNAKKGLCSRLGSRAGGRASRWWSRPQLRACVTMTRGCGQ